MPAPSYFTACCDCPRISLCLVGRLFVSLLPSPTRVDRSWTLLSLRSSPRAALRRLCVCCFLLKMGCLRQRKFLNLENKDPLARIRRRRSTRQPPPTVRRHVARGVARRVVDACAQGAPQIAPPRAFRAARAGGERGAPRCCVALVPSSRDPARLASHGALAPHA